MISDMVWYVICGKSAKYRYIEFFAFDYDSLPISF